MTPAMQALMDHRQRLANAWRGDQEDDNRPNLRGFALSGERVRVPLTLMDHRSVADQSADSQTLEDLRMAHKRKLSRMWQRYHNSARSDVEQAEREARASADYASVPPAPPVTSNAQAIGPQPLSDAGKAAMAKYHQRLEGAWKQEPVQ